VPRAKPSSRSRRPRRPEPDGAAGETPAGNAATVAWTLAASTVLLCNLAAVGAHFLAVRQPDASGPTMLRELLFVAGAAVGLVVLVLTPVVYRVRRIAPPIGFTVFAVCAASAPILALAVRALKS